MWRVVLALLAAAVMTALSTPASATQDDAGVRVSPAVVEQDLADGRLRRDVTFLEEGAPLGWDASVRVVRLGHDLDGNPLFEPDPAIDDAVRIERTQRLGPGGRLDLALRADVPEGQGGLYAAVVGTFTPDATDGPLVSRLELASLLLLRGPRPWDERIEIDTVEASRTSDGYELHAVVSNVGDVHVRPSGTAHLTGPEGEDLGTVELAEQLVLPGYARRLSGAWIPVGDVPASVTVDIHLDNPAAHRSLDVTLPRTAAADAPTGSGAEEAAVPVDDDGRRGLLVATTALLVLAFLLVLLAWRRTRDDEDSPGAGGQASPRTDEIDSRRPPAAVR